MRACIERWLSECKSLFVLPVILLLIVGGWLWPSSSAPDTQERDLQRMQAQWKKLLPLRATLQNARRDDVPTQVFSPVDIPVRRAALVAWRPMGRGGEMQLSVDWQAVPVLFSWFARCGMGVTAFSIRPEKQALLLTVQLEAEDAQ